MIQKTGNNKKAVIILHEIYGVNRFIEDICDKYHTQGYDVFCPEMLQRECFSYSEASGAYSYFINEIGFDFYIVIEQLLGKLKLTYDKVFIIGFSVGATVAWRCCENIRCDGMICCYGSRIRDYLSLRPSCPVLLLFAEKDSFDVGGVIKQLLEKPNVELYKLQAGHGFMDRYSGCFDREQAEKAKAYMRSFLRRHS